MTAAPGECQRFYAISKKIPKDVKRYCGMCRQHGLVVETRGHNCSFKSCDCARCLLIRQRRKIMRTQIRLRRAQDKRFQRTLEPKEADLVPLNQPETGDNDSVAASDRKMLVDPKNMCYFCQKCKNHGVLMWKKDHKRHCRYSNCDCEQCVLIETRRKLDQYLKRSKVGGSPSTSKGVIEYASSKTDAAPEQNGVVCGNSPNTNSNSRVVENTGNSSAWESAFSNPQLKETSAIANPTSSAQISGIEPKALPPYPCLPQDLNSLVMLQMTSSGAMLPASQSMYSNSASIFQHQPYASNLQLPQSDFSKQIAKDITVYASFLNCAQDYMLRENFNSIVF